MSDYTKRKYHVHATVNKTVLSGHQTLTGALFAQARHKREVRQANGKDSYLPTTITKLIDGIHTVIDDFGYNKEPETPALNNNCLKGVRCPKCKQEDMFYIHAKTKVRVTDDGAQDSGDIGWDDQSHTECTSCYLSGPMKLFKY